VAKSLIRVSELEGDKDDRGITAINTRKKKKLVAVEDSIYRPAK
jgi:hypothetical protein